MDTFEAQYWQSRLTAAQDVLTIAELELQLLDAGADPFVYERDRRRLAWDVWNISKRLAASLRP